jgi:hypothetical protein
MYPTSEYNEESARRKYRCFINIAPSGFLFLCIFAISSGRERKVAASPLALLHSASAAVALTLPATDDDDVDDDALPDSSASFTSDLHFVMRELSLIHLQGVLFYASRAGLSGSLILLVLH